MNDEESINILFGGYGYSDPKSYNVDYVAKDWNEVFKFIKNY